MLHGAEEDDVEALREFDQSFYGFAAAAAASDSDSDSCSDTDEKRIDYGSSDDEVFSDDEQALEQSPEDVEKALITAQIRDNVEHGCGCEGFHHWEDLPQDELVCYMFKLRHLQKRDLKQYVLGVLSACAH